MLAILVIIVVDATTAIAIAIAIIYPKGSPHLKRLTGPGLSALCGGPGRHKGERERAG